MALERSFIPYGAYWSTPFCRWQGSLAGLHSIELGARSARQALAARELSPELFDGIVMGLTVPQRHSFYGAPWLAGMIGAARITGPTVAQACATSARMIATAAFEIEAGQKECELLVGCDRTSNGPHVYYPNPLGMGGAGEAENPVLDNFKIDPFARNAMIETAEKVAASAGIGREEQDAMTLLRCAQYQEALADDRAFQRRYLVGVEVPAGKKQTRLVEEDEGVHPTTAEGLAKLRPVLEGGTVTFGSQTHAADGNAGMVVCTEARARELGKEGVMVQLLAVGQARVDVGYMPQAVVPAARDALARAGLSVGDCHAFKTHNPFALNDVYFCRELGLAPERVNRYGSPLVWGHPQAPMGLRAIIELIEELRERGGGVGLFSGCAAGDSAMAVALRVG